MIGTITKNPHIPKMMEGTAASTDRRAHWMAKPDGRQLGQIEDNAESQRHRQREGHDRGDDGAKIGTAAP